MMDAHRQHGEVERMAAQAIIAGKVLRSRALAPPGALAEFEKCGFCERCEVAAAAIIIA